MVKSYWLSSGSYWRGHSSTLLSVRLPGVIMRVLISIICLSFFILRTSESVLWLRSLLLPCVHVSYNCMKSRYIARTVIIFFPNMCYCIQYFWLRMYVPEPPVVRGFSINMVGPDLVGCWSIVWYFVGFIGVSSSTWMQMQSPNDVMPSLVQLAHSSLCTPMPKGFCR